MTTWEGVTVKVFLQPVAACIFSPAQRTHWIIWGLESNCQTRNTCCFSHSFSQLKFGDDIRQTHSTTAPLWRRWGLLLVCCCCCSVCVDQGVRGRLEASVRWLRSTRTQIQKMQLSNRPNRPQSKPILTSGRSWGHWETWCWSSMFTWSCCRERIQVQTDYFSCSVMIMFHWIQCNDVLTVSSRKSLNIRIICMILTSCSGTYDSDMFRCFMYFLKPPLLFSVQDTELTSLGTRLTATESKTSDLEKENAGLWLTNMILLRLTMKNVTYPYNIEYDIQSLLLMHICVRHSVAADKGGVIFNYFIDCLISWVFPPHIYKVVIIHFHDKLLLLYKLYYKLLFTFNQYHRRHNRFEIVWFNWVYLSQSGNVDFFSVSWFYSNHLSLIN